MENPTHSFREANLVLQLIYELQIKSKTFRYQKTLLDTLFLLISKIIESLQCILKAYLSELTILINILRKKGASFNHLSLPDVTNACVQIERWSKQKNSQIVSIWLHLPKVFERIVFKKLVVLWKKKFSSYPISGVSRGFQTPAYRFGCPN